MVSNAENKSKKPPKILMGPPQKDVSHISLGHFIFKTFRENGTRDYLIDARSGDVVTIRQVLETGVKVADILMKRGIKIGDRVSIMSENHPDFMSILCAAIYVGAIFVPYNPAYTEFEVTPLLKIMKPKIIFISKHTEKIVSKIASEASWNMEVVNLDDDVSCGNVITLKYLIETNPDHVDPDRFEPVSIKNSATQPAVILCSSGTTGLPKGVQLSCRNLMCLLATQADPTYSNIKHGDTILNYLPFYHGYAFALNIMAAMKGAKIVMMQSFERQLFLSSIPKYKVTHLPLVPPILVFLAKHPDVPKYDFRSVREVVCGAAALPKELIEEVKQRTGFPFVRNAYGMTEITVVACESDRSSDKLHTGAMSHLVPGLSCKIVNAETGETLGIEEIGEICFKGDRVMLGYYENPQATAETIDRDGWLHTGDLGYIDENDNLHVVDRLKELIKYKAYQVSPVEIEQLLLSHPDIKDAAVAGKPNVSAGELPMAFIVKQPGSKVTAEEIQKFVKEKLSPQKWLRGGIRFVPAIPKNPTGKILRRELRVMVSKL